MTIVLAGLSRSACSAEIHDTAATGTVEAVQSLGKPDPRLINSRDRRGWTPLAHAAWNGSRAMAEYLLANGADINATNRDGETPLHLASREGHREMAAYLKKRGRF